MFNFKQFLTENIVINADIASQYIDAIQDETDFDIILDKLDDLGFNPKMIEELRKGWNPSNFQKFKPKIGEIKENGITYKEEENSIYCNFDFTANEHYIISFRFQFYNTKYYFTKKLGFVDMERKNYLTLSQLLDCFPKEFNKEELANYILFCDLNFIIYHVKF